MSDFWLLLIFAIVMGYSALGQIREQKVWNWYGAQKREDAPKTFVFMIGMETIFFLVALFFLIKLLI